MTPPSFSARVTGALKSARAHCIQSLGLLASMAILAAVGYADFLADRPATAFVLYLIPLTCAVWFAGLWQALLICGLIAVIRVGIHLTSPETIATDVWNVAMQW